MKLGKYNIDIVDTGLFRLDGGSMFGVVPKAIWAKAYDPGDELNRIPLAARLLLIRWDDTVLLVDTGNGNKMNNKIKNIYAIDIAKSSIDNALKPFGVAPADVTDVIFTHLHFDHAGGATILKDSGNKDIDNENNDNENNKIVPVFPNAKHYVQKEHLEWALSPTEKDRASFIKANFQPLIDRGLIETLDGNGEIYPGISVIRCDGHTRAMQLVKITAGGQALLYCADLAATSAHIRPAFGMGYDNFPLEVIEEKKRIFTQAAEEDWTLVFEHDAFMQAAKIQIGAKDFEIKEEIIITPKD